MKRLAFVLLVLNAALLPLSCIPALVVVNTVNPMQIAFITDFDVVNNTDELLRITPLGRVRQQRHPLPIYRSRLPAIQAERRGGSPLPAGQTMTIMYDHDDIAFSEIVVEDAHGDLRQLSTGAQTGQFAPPRIRRFVIDRFDALDPVTDEVRAGWAEAQQPFRFWRVVLPLALPVLTFVPVLSWWRRLRKGPGEERRTTVTT